MIRVNTKLIILCSLLVHRTINLCINLKRLSHKPCLRNYQTFCTIVLLLEMYLIEIWPVLHTFFHNVYNQPLFLSVIFHCLSYKIHRCSRSMIISYVVEYMWKVTQESKVLKDDTYRLCQLSAKKWQNHGTWHCILYIKYVDSCVYRDTNPSIWHNPSWSRWHR